MISYQPKLFSPLVEALKTAEEAWIAVALLNKDGFNCVLGNLPETCKQHYLIGVDLPTHPDVLVKLSKLHAEKKIEALLYKQKDFFHPKMYLLRQNGSYSIFIGSANCTSAGLKANVELTVQSKDEELAVQLIEWFKKLSVQGIPIEPEFIETYRKQYAARMKRVKLEESVAQKQKKAAAQANAKVSNDKKSIIKLIKAYMKKADYKRIVNERTDTVSTLKETLSYPDFNNIDIDGFFKIQELGHIISIAKKSVKLNINNLQKLLTYLCDESIDIATRYDRVLKGDLKIKQINNAFISKILAIHRPDLYYVDNGISSLFIKKFGPVLPRGMSVGNKYNRNCEFLQELVRETKIKNLAVLDHYLYLEGKKLSKKKEVIVEKKPATI